MRMSAWCRLLLPLGAAGLVAAAGGVPAHPARVLIQGTGIYPESITSTSDGTLIIGSIGKGSVFRSKAGATAEPWIAAGTQGLLSVFGVLADEKSQTLWVCSSEATNGSFVAAPGDHSSAECRVTIET